MRVHLSPNVVRLLYALREQGAPIRAALEAIRQNPDLPEALRDPARPHRRELFVKIGVRGYWIGYEVERSGNETVILVGALEEN